MYRMQIVNLHNLQNMLHNFKIVHAQAAKFCPNITVTLTRMFIQTLAKLHSTFCKVCQLTNCVQLMYPHIYISRVRVNCV